MKITLWLILPLLLQGIAGATEWQAAGPYGGSATAVAISPSRPDTLYAGARNSLIYRSDNQGRTWQRLAFPRHFLGTVSAVAVHPHSPEIVYAALSAEHSAYGGVWKSTDGGRSWKLSHDLAGVSAEALAVFPRNPDIIVAGTRTGVWLSRDGGAKWTQISRPWNHEMRVITAVAIDPLDERTIYAGTPHLPWKTEDGGETWKSIHTGMLDDSDVFSIFVDPAQPENLLASACSGIYRSDSKGETWSKFKGIPATHRRTHVIRLHPEKKNVIFAGTTLGLLKSVDGGANFRQLNRLHIVGMTFDPRDADRIYLATEGTGLWRSDDGGQNVTPLNEGFVNRKMLDIAVAGSRLISNSIQDGEGGGVYVSEDGGSTWTLGAGTKALGDNHIHHVAGHPEDGNLLFAANERKLLRSTDGGKTWRNLAMPGKAGQTRIGALATLRQKPFTILLGTDQGLFKSTDLGATWAMVPIVKVKVAPKVTALAVAGPRILAQTASALYLSEDAGGSWKPLNLLIPTSLVYDVAVPPSAKAPILLATAKGLMRSEDGGKTWIQKDRGLQEGTVSSVRYQAGAAGLAWAVQFGRLYRSEDYGRNWEAVEGGEIPESTIRTLWADQTQSDRLFALTPDLGLYYLNTKDFRLHNLEKAGTP